MGGDAESTLVARVAAGDADAVSEFDAHYRPRLRFIAGRSGLPAHVCDDVVQDVLSTGVLQIRAGKFRGESCAGTWLHSILKAQIADHWRRIERRRDARSPTALSPAVDASALVDGTLSVEMRALVRDALEQLPPLHRTVLVLNQFGGFTGEEIALRIKRPPGTVGRVLAEAKHQLRAALRREDFVVPGRPSRRDPR